MQSQPENSRDEFLSGRDLSEYLRIKIGTVYSMAEDGRIPCYKFGRLLRFKKSEVDRWVEEQKKEPVAPKKVGSKILSPKQKQEIDVDRVVRKAIDGTRGQGYTKPHGKTGPSQGPRKGGS